MTINHTLSHRRLWLITALLMAVLTVALAPTVARAASTYNVEECGASFANDGVFGFQESNAGFVGSVVGCNDGLSGLSLWPNQSNSGMALGDHASWGFTAPSGEAITGLGTINGQYHSSDGWISGWAVNGLVADDPLPGNEDCTRQNQMDACTRTSNGWVTVPHAGSVQLLIRCDASSTSSNTNCKTGLSYASADVYTTVVQLQDPKSPLFSNSGALWQAANGSGLSHGWVSGLNAGASLGLKFAATNPAGICRLEATLTNPHGTVVASTLARAESPVTDSSIGSKLSTTPPFGYALPCGSGGASGQFAPNLSKLPTGVYYLNVGAQDPPQYQDGAESYATGASPAGGYPIAIDNSVPTVGISTTTNAGTWYPTSQTATITANDASGSSGLESLRCNLDGSSMTYPLSGDHAVVSIPIATDGVNHLSCVAASAAGNVSPAQSVAVNIDSQRPSVAFSGAMDAPAWATTAQTVTVTAAEPVALAGIASTSCSLDGAAATTVSGAEQTIRIAGDGVHRLLCSATTRSGVTGRTVSYTVQIDGQAPEISFAGPAAAPAWVSGNQIVVVHAAEPSELSGIATTSCRRDGGAWVTIGGDTQRVAVGGSGSHTITCHATTAAGVIGPDTSETLQVDDQLPRLTLSGAPPQGNWYRSSESVVAAASALGGADLVSIDCSIGGLTRRYPAAAGQTTERVRIEIAPPGGNLVCRAVDAAGNRSHDASWSFQLDDTAPGGVFEPANPGNPTALTVHVWDSGSGVASVQVQIDEQVGWRNLRTTYDRRRAAAMAQVPDDGSLRNGTYAVRAIVVDRAGNEAIVAGDRAGSAEVVTLPLRQLTDISAVMHAGKRRVFLASLGRARVLSVRHGQRVTLSGRLVASAGSPVARARVVVSQRVVGRSVIRRLGQTRTGAQGQFTFVVPGGPSRTVIVDFPGSRTLRTSTASSVVRVRGLARLFVPRTVRAGRRTTIRGRVLGGFIPSTGVLVQLWYRIRGGRSAWEPFERAIRANRRGAFRLTFPVSRAARGLSYSFRAVVAGQSGWPYMATVSNVETRRFR